MLTKNQRRRRNRRERLAAERMPPLIEAEPYTARFTGEDARWNQYESARTVDARSVWDRVIVQADELSAIEHESSSAPSLLKANILRVMRELEDLIRDI